MALLKSHFEPMDWAYKTQRVMRSVRCSIYMRVIGLEGDIKAGVLVD